MKAFLALMIFGSGISAFANTVVHCEQTSSDEYGYHDIFVVEVNEKSQAVSIDEISWNDKENRKAGGGTLGYYGSKPFKAK